MNLLKKMQELHASATKAPVEKKAQNIIVVDTEELLNAFRQYGTEETLSLVARHEKIRVGWLKRGKELATENEKLKLEIEALNYLKAQRK